MLAQRRQGFLGILAGLVVFRRLLFVCFDVVLVILHHVLGEFLVELRARHFRHSVIISLLFAVGLGRRRDLQRGGGRRGLLIGLAVILHKHLTELFDGSAGAVLLGELAHLHFG